MYYKTMTNIEYIVQEHECKINPNILVDVKFALRSYSPGEKPSRYYPGCPPDYDYDVYVKHENCGEWVTPDSELLNEITRIYEGKACDNFERQRYDNIV